MKQEIEEAEIVKELFDHIAMFRGVFINKMSYIERVFEIVISNHYCKKELQVEFIDFVIGEKFLPFEAKRVALQNILQKHHAEVYNDNQKMFKNIDLFQPHRNKLAHYMACVTDEAIERFEKDKTFGLLQYFEKKSPVWYDAKLQKEIAIAVDEVFEWCRIQEIDEPE